MFFVRLLRGGGGKLGGGRCFNDAYVEFVVCWRGFGRCSEVFSC